MPNNLFLLSEVLVARSRRPPVRMVRDSHRKLYFEQLFHFVKIHRSLCQIIHHHPVPRPYGRGAVCRFVGAGIDCKERLSWWLRGCPC